MELIIFLSFFGVLALVGIVYGVHELKKQRLEDMKKS